MGRVLKLLAGLLAVSLLATAAYALPPQSLGRSIDAYLAPLLRTNNFSGVVLVAKGDTIVFQ